MERSEFIEYVALQVAKEMQRQFLNGLYLGYIVGATCGGLVIWWTMR